MLDSRCAVELATFKILRNDTGSSCYSLVAVRTECQAKNKRHAPYKYLISYVKERMPFHFNTLVAHTVLHRIDQHTSCRYNF